MSTALLLTILAAAVSVTAAVVAAVAMREARSLARRFRNQLALVHDLDERFEDLAARRRKAENREHMRAARAAQSDAFAPPDPTADPAGWKRAMRAKLGLIPGRVTKE